MTNLEQFLARWSGSEGSERANAQPFLGELCELLGVEKPRPATGDSDKDDYAYERDAQLLHSEGQPTLGKVDLYKAGHFILEAKQGAGPGSRSGKVRRDTNAWHGMMTDAKAQATKYTLSLDDPPPFLIVCDVGHAFWLYACFDGSRAWYPFPNSTSYRFFLKDLPAQLPTLKAIWTDPFSLDPARRTAAVTREAAAKLADLSKELEGAGHRAETVATFLMRAIFTMFAEDVKLLPDQLFTRSLKERWIPAPERFPADIEALWQAMNHGRDFGFEGKLLKFNGGLFSASQALPLSKGQLEKLLEAGRCDWKDVEPSIFGTLLERALDPKERHALGAHYTPRAYVERLVKATVEDPLRAEWDVVCTQVRILREEESPSKIAEAEKAVREFHHKLCTTRVLDPACGTGNFLYVTLDLFKRLEGEVLRLLSDLRPESGTTGFLDLQGVSVTPQQFLGIEKKRGAKEIAELVLWIGYLQWHFRTHGNTPPDEPVLRDYKNIECRDAVLVWDKEELVTDPVTGKSVTRWDGESMKPSPVTGEPVPDESKTKELYRYVNPRKAEWPEADYVVGNPPFLGKLHFLADLGPGYVAALRATYDGEVPDSADLVMYWWHKAARLVSEGKLARFGFVTTNSITQTFNRRIVEAALSGTPPVHIDFAIPDHPWIDSVDGAGVRIAMSVVGEGPGSGSLATVRSETFSSCDASADVTLITRRGRINGDLTVGAALVSAKPISANEGLASMGPALGSRGFLLTAKEREEILVADGELADRFIRPIRNGRDLTALARGVYAIDLFGMTSESVRQTCPAIYQRLLERVFPERAQNNDPKLREQWWLFRRSNELWRQMLAGLERHVITVETAKHRVFHLQGREVIGEHGTISFGLEDAYFLGVLSSRLHVVWALAAGGRLGVGNDPRYNKSRCFDPFPFPACTDAQKARIRDLGEQLDAHRKARQALHPTLTITGMYNVLEKLRSGEALDAKERGINDQGLVSTLKEIHDELDAAVFDAYGWPVTLTDEEILERLVALNAERAEEEKKGLIRWLRPEFQNPGGTRAATQVEIDTGGDDDDMKPAVTITADALPWPKTLPGRIAAVRDLLVASPAPRSLDSVVAAFKKSKSKEVEPVLDSLAALGHLLAFDSPSGRLWKAR